MKKRKGGLGRFLVLILVLLALVGLWYFGNYTIQTEEISVYSADLPQGFDGYRIVQVSDLHGKIFGEDQEDLLEAISLAEPDVVVITGDLVDDESQIWETTQFLEDLCKLYATYYITGNHEWDMDTPVADQLACWESAGVVVLDDDFVPLVSQGQAIVLAGFSDPNGGYDKPTPQEVMEQVRQEHGDAFVVGLYHRNDQLDAFADLEVDLLLSGHGHGGIVRLPFVGGLIDTDRTLFPEYDAGLYTQDGTQMMVSRGLGGNGGLDFRVLNRPHLPVLVLRCAS